MRAQLCTICLLLSACVVTMLAGCMVGPDYTRPQTIAETAHEYVYAGEHPAGANDVRPVGRWWERFGDPVTTQLVHQALENNYDLKAAAARVLQAQAGLAEAKGRLWPDISFNFSRTMSRSNTFAPGSYSPFGVLKSSVIKTRSYTPNFSISYVLDLFGKLRRMERAAWADLLAAEASEQAITNSLIASVVIARINIATIQKQLAIARANTDNWQKTLKSTESRYIGASERGRALDVGLARENFEASKSAELILESALIKAQNALDVLLGRRPGSSEGLPLTLPNLPDLTPVPVGVPAMLLDRRPDVKAAELALRSSNEQIGVSVAQLFPDLTLAGSLGWQSYKSDDIFIEEAYVYSTVLRAIQPLFKGGQLRARVDAAKARYSELGANYAQTVLTALREVEDALANEQLLQTRHETLEDRLEKAVTAETIAKRRYMTGVGQMITVLETERRRRLAEDELNSIKGELWSSRVNLFLALGGDWVTDSRNASPEDAVAVETGTGRARKLLGMLGDYLPARED